MQTIVMLMGTSGLALAGYDSARSLLARLPPSAYLVRPLLRAKRILQDKHEKLPSGEGQIGCPKCGRVLSDKPNPAPPGGCANYICGDCDIVFCIDADGNDVQEPKPQRDMPNCPGCGNLAIAAPGGVGADGSWPYVCEQCGKHFTVNTGSE